MIRLPIGCIPIPGLEDERNIAAAFILRVNPRHSFLITAEYAEPYPGEIIATVKLPSLLDGWRERRHMKP